MRKKRIGIVGPIETNFGDYAMCINNIYDMMPVAEHIDIFLYDKRFKEDGDLFEAYGLDKKTVTFHFVEIEGEMLNKCPTAVEIMNHTAEADVLEKCIQELDILVVSGGGYINQLWYRLWLQEKLLPIFAVMHFANRQAVPIRFMGNTFGPFGESFEFFRYQLLELQDVQFAVRDKIMSKNALIEMGIKEENITFVPDDLLFLNSNVLKLFERKEQQKVVKNYVVLELFYKMQDVEAMIQPLQHFVRIMKEKYKSEVLLLPFDKDEGGMLQMEYIVQKIPQIHLYECEDDFLPIEDATKIIRSAKLVVCTRYHAYLTALQQKTPVVCIMRDICGDKRYYYNKIHGLFQYLFQNNTLVRETDFIRDDYVSSLEFVQENYEMLIEKQTRGYHSTYYAYNVDKVRKKRKKYIRFITSSKRKKNAWDSTLLRKIVGGMLCVKQHGVIYFIKESIK